MDIKTLFPLKAEITQEIIDGANTYSVTKCIGAKTLRTAVESKTNTVFSTFAITWGSHSGNIETETSPLNIGTEEDINMMRVTEPQTVTFKLI
jgi:hypothetical protein